MITYFPFDSNRQIAGFRANISEIRRINGAQCGREERGEKGRRQEEKRKNEKVELTDSLVHGGIDHGAKLGEARLPHDVGGALHPF